VIVTTTEIAITSEPHRSERSRLQGVEQLECSMRVPCARASQQLNCSKAVAFWGIHPNFALKRVVLELPLCFAAGVTAETMIGTLPGRSAPFRTTSPLGALPPGRRDPG